MPEPRVLMVAFHYPPCSGSSGILRTLKFSRYLRDQGWGPIVLTAQPRAYPTTGVSQLAEIPAEVPVHRAFALDARRHLAVRGSSPRLAVLPDQWSSWWLGAVPAGLRLIRRHRPQALWSTFPIATAHLIGLTLQRLSGLPWIADFRDSMTEDDYPTHPRTRQIYRWIESRTVRAASSLVFTAPSASRMYLSRYPGLSASRCAVIPNGYDEDDFAALSLADARPRPAGGPLRMVHAGLMYQEERDPRPFFQAVARLRREGRVTPEILRVELRAPGSDEYYTRLTTDLGIQDLVHILPSLPYRESLADCASAAGLLIFQGKSCNHQIPAKAYEYLRLRRPILALTSADGDTAALLTECGGSTLVELSDEQAIYQTLPTFLEALRAGAHPLPDPDRAARYARRNQAGQLGQLLVDASRR
jgi:glycosyltransferase involved in cell wall biosynthesis